MYKETNFFFSKPGRLAKLIFAPRARKSILVKPGRAGPVRKIDFRAPGAKINFGEKPGRAGSQNWFSRPGRENQFW